MLTSVQPPPLVAPPRLLRSLRGQTALLFGSLSVLVCALLAGLLSELMTRELRQETHRGLDAIAQSTASTLANGLTERLREARVMAASTQLWADGLASPAVVESLRRSQATRPHNIWIGVADVDGVVRAATGNLLLGRNVSQRPWFRQGLVGPYVGDVHAAELLAKLLPSSETGEPHRFVDFAAPVSIDGTVAGVLGVHGTWDWASDVIRSLLPSDAIKRRLELFIFSRSGELIYSPDTVRRNPALAAQTLAALSGGDSSLKSPRPMVWADGERYVTSLAPLPQGDAVTDLGWTVVAREPVSVAFAGARSAGINALLIGLVLALVATLLAWLASARVSGPLSRIAAAARDVERGVAGAKIPIIDRNDEFERLSTALAGMTNRLHATIQTAPIGICQVEVDGRVSITNDRLCQVLECSGDALVGRQLTTLLANEDRSLLEAGLKRLKAGQNETFAAEHRLVRAGGGGPIVAAISASLVRTPGGAPGYFIVVIEDITPRKEGEAAERANVAKTAFLSQMSHELRTPLNAVLGFTQLMQMDPDDRLSPAQAERAAKIASAGAHLLAMIDDILDLSRIEIGKLSLSPEAVAIGAVVEQAVSLLAVAATNAGVAVTVVTAPGAGVDHVRADRVRLRQVLVNLLSNAIKYNRAGGSVQIRWRSGSRDGMVEIEVADTGIGLNPKQLKHLFEPFNRLGAASSGVEGTGIGLVITRKLVEMMDGDITVASEVGSGSRFTVGLPAATLPIAGTGAAPLAAAAPATGPAQLAPCTVLYVEDNELNIELLQAFLKVRADVKLVVARSGEEALALAPQLEPDLFLLDMHLADMTGTQLVRRLKGIPHLAARPCVALSADAMESSIAAAVDAGFTAYLTKPLHLPDLLACIDRARQPEAMS